MKHTPRTPAITAAIATVLCLGLITGCSNNNELDDFHETLETPETEPTTSQTDTTSGTSTTAAEKVDPDYDTLDELWQQLLTATGLPTGQRTPALEAIDTLAAPVIETAATLPANNDTTTAYTYPVYQPQPDGTINIQDCTLYQPAITNSVPHHHTATAKHDNNGNWTITQFERQTPNCVPNQIAQPALDGYQAHVETHREYWNPPDPNHPGLEQTLTTEFRRKTVDTLQKALDEGRYLVIDGDIAPEITFIYSPKRLLITDCRTHGENAGLFFNNGELVPDVFQPERGGIARYVVDMQLEDDIWKAADVTEITIGNCDEASTKLRIVG